MNHLFPEKQNRARGIMQKTDDIIKEEYDKMKNEEIKNRMN